MVKICYILSEYRSHRRAGLDYLNSLQAQGVVTVDTPEEAEIVIIHDEPWTYPDYYRALPILAQRYVIAYAVWEPDRLSADVARWIGMVDEIWTCSSYCHRVIAPAAKNITIIPHIVPPPLPADAAAEQGLRAHLGLPENGFLFYTISRQEERKNLEAGIRAFARAFPEGSVNYLVKTPFALPAELNQIPGVIPVSEFLDDQAIARLHRIGHCFVSPHCSEGWGLGLSDAMACGNLVLATAYGGNMDYMDKDTALPVGFSLEAIRQPEARRRFGFEATDMNARWAYVDEDDLSAQMMRAFREWDDLASLRQAARQRMADYDAERIGRLMLSRLQEVLIVRSRGSTSSPPRFARPMG